MLAAILPVLLTLNVVVAHGSAESVKGDTTVGCLTSTPETATLVDGVYDADECQDSCFKDSAYAYSYFGGESSECYCGDSGLNNTLIAESHYNGTCVETESYLVHQYTSALKDKELVSDPEEFLPTFTYSSCFDPAVLESELAENLVETFENVTDIAACFEICQDYDAAILFPKAADDEEGGFKCGCTDDSTGLPEAAFLTHDQDLIDSTCSVESYYAFISTRGTGSTTTDVPPPSASDLVRRRQRRAAMAARKVKKTLCPANHKACAVAPGSEEFECVDTLLDAKFCGGCPYGDVETKNRLTSGTDCSALPHVLRKLSNCVAGKCQIGRCADGFVLSADKSTCGRDVNKYSRA